MAVFEIVDYPGMEEHISYVISFLYIFAEHVLQQVNTRVADCGPSSSFKVRFCSQNSFFYLLAISPFEWHFATEELISYDTEAPNIASEVARLIQVLLRCLVS